MWIGEVLKEAMNVVEKRACFLEEAKQVIEHIFEFSF
jgi:hypothetical protein